MIDLRPVIHGHGQRMVDAAKQVPFATSQAMNDVAFGVRKDAFWDELPRRFRLRNRFLQKGLRPGATGPGGIGVEKADKRNLRVRIFFGQGAEFLSLHQHSGVKRLAAGRKIYIPAPTRPGYSEQKIFRIKAKLERLDKPGSRYFTVGKGTARERIVERVAGKEPGVRTTRTKKGQLRERKRFKREVHTLWWVENSARIKKVLQVNETAKKLSQERFPAAFRKALLRAMETAK